MTGLKEVFEVIRPWILLAKGVPAFFFVTSATIDNQFFTCLHQKIALILDAPGSRVCRPRSKRVRSVLFDSVVGVNFAKLQDGIQSLTYRHELDFSMKSQLFAVSIFELYLKTQTPYLSSLNKLRSC